MIDIIIDTLIDGIKLLPFLFFTFLIIEYLEHKTSKKGMDMINKNKKYGPIIGSLLGAIPQCGLSVMATNFYAMRVISLGTLISIYLSTSDEMVPLLLSNKTDPIFIIEVLLIKVVVGMIAGFLIDYFIRQESSSKIEKFCDEEHCDCNHGIVHSALIHTIKIFIYIIAVTFILNFFFEYFGKEKITSIFMKNNFFVPFITALIGFIPNCASSVIITELYLNHAISFASLISGLLTGSGVALLVLFKVNNNSKENIKILSILYVIGALVGIILNLF